MSRIENPDDLPVKPRPDRVPGVHPLAVPEKARPEPLKTPAEGLSPGFIQSPGKEGGAKPRSPRPEDHRPGTDPPGGGGGPRQEVPSTGLARPGPRHLEALPSQRPGQRPPPGAPFLAVLSLKEGKHEHLLINTLGPTEIWAFSTTAEDAALRGRLYAILGPVEARRRLSRRFPGGSAKGEIERRLAVAMERGRSEEGAQEGVVEELVKELVGQTD